MAKNENDVTFEIRFFLKENRDADKELFEMFKTISEELHPIKHNEVGRWIFQKAYDFWYLKERKKKED